MPRERGGFGEKGILRRHGRLGGRKGGRDRLCDDLLLLLRLLLRSLLLSCRPGFVGRRFARRQDGVGTRFWR